MSAASPQEVNRFVLEVDKFQANYARLAKPETRAEVYASGNNNLIDDYESAVSQGAILRTSINATVGAWNAAKSVLVPYMDKTSAGIGDVVDTIRSWFGYKPMGGLGAFQIPAAAWIVGIAGTAYILNNVMNKIFVSVEASRIQRDNPNITRAQAVDAANRAINTSNIFGNLSLPLIAAAALAAYLIFWREK